MSRTLTAVVVTAAVVAAAAGWARYAHSTVLLRRYRRQTGDLVNEVITVRQLPQRQTTTHHIPRAVHEELRINAIRRTP